MFKDGECEHHCSHDTHQANSPILAKSVPALYCQWLQQLLLFVPLSSSRSHTMQFLSVEICGRIGQYDPMPRGMNELKARITEPLQPLAMQC